MNCTSMSIPPTSRELLKQIFKKKNKKHINRQLQSTKAISSQDGFVRSNPIKLVYTFFLFYKQEESSTSNRSQIQYTS